MRVEYTHGFGNGKRSINFIVDEDEITRLDDYSRRRIEVLLAQGTFENVLEALAIIQTGPAPAYDTPGYDQFEAMFGGSAFDEEEMRRAAERMWDQLHGDYTGPYQEPNTESPRYHRAGPHWSNILGVKAGATKAEIKKAYRKLAKEHHPDRGGDPGKFKQVQDAYEEAQK